jgi:hypothetical protein
MHTVTYIKLLQETQSFTSEVLYHHDTRKKKVLV